MITHWTNGHVKPMDQSEAAKLGLYVAYWERRACHLPLQKKCLKNVEPIRSHEM
jgi:hypothetical protein